MPPSVAETSLSAQTLRLQRIVAGTIFLIVFAVYGLTMCRTIYTGDDGDFITAMATLGIPHPTGYPLFCLLGHLWLAAFPWGSPAFKINLMTALCGAASISVLSRFLMLLVSARRWYVAASGALFLAFAPTLWQQSLSCEVYALTCVFLAVMLYLTALWQAQPGNLRLLYGMTFTYGLALTNHMTMALFLPGFLVFVLTRRPTLWREGRTLLALVGCFVLPLLLYLYLPWAARHGAPIPWGNPYNWANFKAHVTGEMFRDRMFSGPDVMARQSRLYAGALWAEFGGPVLLALSVYGLFALWRRGQQGRALALLLAFIALADLTYALNYDVFDIYVYFIPSYLILAVFFTVGTASLFDAIQARIREENGPGAAAWRIAILVLLLLPIIPLSRNWPASDKSGNYLEDDLSANIMRSAPPHALIITSSNVTFSLWYRRFVLGERPDVVPIYSGMTRGMYLYDAWYFRHLARMYPAITQTYAPDDRTVVQKMARGEFLRDVMRQAAARGVPVIVVPDPRYTRQKISGTFPSFDELLVPYFDRVPWGIADRLFLKGNAPAPGDVVRENARLWASFSTRGLYTGWSDADPMQEHIGRRYAEASLALGVLAEHAGRFDVALSAYERVLRLFNVPEARDGRARCVVVAASARTATGQEGNR